MTKTKTATKEQLRKAFARLPKQPSYDEQVKMCKAKGYVTTHIVPSSTVLGGTLEPETTCVLNKSLNVVKGRDKPNDVFVTPTALAKKHIAMVDYKPDDIWYDPFRGSAKNPRVGKWEGQYYNNFPKECKKEWTEIEDGRDFFKFNKKVDIICSNLPFSIINKVLQKSIELRPRIISYVMGTMNLTIPRLQMLNDAGYSLKKHHLVNVDGWFQTTTIVHFERLDKIQNVMTFDRNIYKGFDPKKNEPKMN